MSKIYIDSQIPDLSNKKLRIINSYRLTQIDKYIGERKEEYINCKNKCNISSFHYEKLIMDIDKILRSFPDTQFISLYYDDENINSIFYSISEKLNSKERLLLYELIENKNEEIKGLQKCYTYYYNLCCRLSSKLSLINKYISNSDHELSVDSYYKFKDLCEFDEIKRIIFDEIIESEKDHQFERKDKVVNDLLKRISNLEFDVEDKQREIERLNNELEEFEKFQEEHRIMKQILIENNLWETLLNDDRFLEYLRK